MLPLRLVQFWYPDSLATFIRSYFHTLAVLEEDLAVGLMWRLLFTPLFHDSSIVGRVLSFIFRLVRVLIGLFAYLLTTLVFLGLALVWFALPVLLILPELRPFPEIVLLFGFALFIDRVLLYPRKKLYQIKNIKELWLSTKLNPKQVTWVNLLSMEEVKGLINSLELDSSFFNSFKPSFSDELLSQVFKLAKDAHAQYITPSYFWVALLLSIPNIDNELLKEDLSTQNFIEALNFLEHKRNDWRMVNVWDEDFAVHHLKGVNRGWLSSPTPVLDSVSVDLTKQAASEGFPEFIGRSDIVAEVINILSSDKDRNVLLVAPPGCGKTALVNSLSSRIVAGDAPKALATKRLVSLDLSRLLSNVSGEGDLATKVKEVFDEVSFVKDIIIFVDEIQNLGLGEAGEGYNLYSLMQPHLESSQFQFIASTELDNYNKILERNPSFARVFNKVELPTASLDDTTLIIQERAVDLERYNHIKVTSRAIKEIVDLSSRFVHDRVLPDSAVSILSECQTLAKAQTSKQKFITTEVVKEVFSKRVNVPIDSLGNDQKEVLLNLEELIHQKMIDQEEAVKAVSDTLRRSATSLRDINRPIGSFLFVGPTGVGKTELAKTLAEVYFNKGDTTHAPFLRFDMSEYQTPEAVNRLLGDEENPGELTEAVKDKPYCLILLDEFEKADPKILTLFLQVLDDGRLTDSTGVTVDFTNTIIIATSNAASLLIAQDLEKGQNIEVVKPAVQQELLKVFRPELVNRFDEIVVFKPLSKDDLSKIVTLKLNDLKKLLKNGGYLIDFSPELVTQLGIRGFDPVLGARPLRRLIQDSLEAKLSRMILENKLTKGQTYNFGKELLAN